MMLKKIIVLIFICILTFVLTHVSNAQAKSQRWDINQTYTIESKDIPVFTDLNINANPAFKLQKGMLVTPIESIDKEGYKWFKLNDRYWIPAMEPGGIVNLSLNQNYNPKKIVDLYGILDQPHRYAVKMTKYPGAIAKIETYKKVGDEYILNEVYEASYRKDGPKAKYGDLKSPGGPVVRYLYRTTRSSMNGWDDEGRHFGVYKVSFPMPHDALPYLLNGKMSTYQYEKIPAINYHGDTLLPHPHSMLGADILIHTKAKGSLGCINIENEKMSDFYNKDIATENDKEIIPFIIYDEDVVAPPTGQLF